MQGRAFLYFGGRKKADLLSGASAGHTLDVRVTPGLTYCGDEYAIRQLVPILLDNAVKYAAPDTPIVFSLEKGRRGIVIRTENQCDALDTSALWPPL